VSVGPLFVSAAWNPSGRISTQSSCFQKLSRDLPPRAPRPRPGLFADTALIECSVVDSGDAKPIGEPSWLTVRFADGKGHLGASVLGTLDVSRRVDKELVSSFFDFPESIDPSSVRISDVVGTKLPGGARVPFRPAG
jgi:hypothetical protein